MASGSSWLRVNLLGLALATVMFGFAELPAPPPCNAAVAPFLPLTPRPGTLLCPSPSPTPRQAKEIDTLVNQLGHERQHTRDQAEVKLQEIGEVALEQLKVAARLSPDLEVRRRADRLVDQICEHALDSVTYPSIFALDEEFQDFVYYYFRKQSDTVIVFPIDENLGFFGRWLREKCLVVVGGENRPKTHTAQVESRAMANLFADMRSYLGNRRALAILRRLPKTAGVRFNTVEFQKHHYFGHYRFTSLEAWVDSYGKGAK